MQKHILCIVPKVIAVLLATCLFSSQAYSASVANAEIEGAGFALSSGYKWIVALLAGGGGAALLAKNLESGQAVYAVEVNLNRDDIYWVRWVGWPSIFPVLRIEGGGEYVIPEIFYNYDGGTIIWTFKIPQIPAKRHIAVFLLDDHSTSNEIWNHLLETRVSFDFGGQTVTSGILARGTVTGNLQLSDSHLTIDGPTPICHYFVECPDPWFSNEWYAEGNLTNGAGKILGTIRLSQLMNKE